MPLGWYVWGSDGEVGSSPKITDDLSLVAWGITENFKVLSLRFEISLQVRIWVSSF